MKKDVLRILIVACLLITCHATIFCQSVGDKFISADSKMVYTIVSLSNENAVSVAKNGSPTGEINIPDTVRYNSVLYNVTKIASSAFINCGGITSVVIGKNIKDIGQLAFYGTTNVTEVHFNASKCNDVESSGNVFNQAYFAPLSTVYIGAKVERIPANLFRGYTNMSSLIFEGESVCKTIGNYSFEMCSNTSFRSLVIPESVDSIGAYSFNGCSSIRYLTVGSAVHSIGESAFRDLNSLIEVKYNAVNCADLTKPCFSNNGPAYTLNVGSRVKKIPAYLFCNSKSLGTVIFEAPSVCSAFGSFSFAGCTLLESIAIPGSMKNIGSNAFYYNTALKSFSIPSSVDSIGEGAFSMSPVLLKLEQANQSFFIQDSVLYNKAMTKLYACYLNKTGEYTIPSTVENILAKSFYNCAKLCSVTIPTSVTSIGASAFEGSAVNCIRMLNSTPASINSNSFFLNSSAKLYVPRGAKVSYMPSYATYFNDGANIIEGTDFISDGTFKYVVIDSVKRKLSVIENGFHYSGSLTVPDSITYDGKIYYVTQIENQVFSNSPGLNAVVLPASMENLGTKTFQYSENLVSVNVPDKVTEIGSGLFQGCKGLQHCTIGKSVETIRDYAFANCSSLSKVVLPDATKVIGDNAFLTSGLTRFVFGKATKKIGKNAFDGCTGLDSLVLGNAVDSIGERAFYSCWGLTTCVLGKSLKYLGDYAFYSCTALKSISLPDSVKAIGNYCFQANIELKNCTLPRQLKRIGQYAFDDCRSLSSIVIPDSVKVIDDYAFSACKKLTNLTLGNTVDSIGNSAFLSCISLAEVTIPESVTMIGNYTFRSCSSLKNLNFNARKCLTMGPMPGNTSFANCDSLANLYIGSEVTYIPSYAFRKLIALTSISISDQVEYIGKYSFYDCSNVTNVTIGKSVKSIDGMAFGRNSKLVSLTINAKNLASAATAGSPVFYLCSALTSVIIGDSVTKLPNNLFNTCTNVVSLKMKCATPPTLVGANVFGGISSNALLYVPNGSKINYMNYNVNSTYTNSFSSLGSTTDGARIIEYSADGINDIQSTGIHIYSKDKGQISISNSDALAAKINIYSVAGIQMYAGELTGNQQSLAVNLMRGLYVVELQLNNKKYTDKIIIE